MTDGMVLVTGASGTVGRPLVAALLAAGQQVRAGVRDPKRGQLPAGVEVVRLDFLDPATAGPALLDVDRIFLMRPPAISDVATALGPLVEAAAQRRVQRMVVLSVMGVNPALPHWRMERMVRLAGLPMTALRPSYFAQNLLTAFGDDIRLRSQLPLASGNGRVSFIDTRDIAEAAARIFTDLPGHPAEPVTLTGPEALTFEEVASVLSAELGRPITYLRQSLWQRRRTLQAQGMPSAYVNVQLVIDITTRLGLARKITPDLPRILGRPATSMTRFIHDERAGWLS